MTRNEYIALRIAELEARRDAANQLVLNKSMAVEVKLIDAQIKFLLTQREMTVITDIEIVGGNNPLTCAHSWGPPLSTTDAPLGPQDYLECAKCGATRPTTKDNDNDR